MYDTEQMSNAKADFCKIYVKFSGFPIVSIHPYRPKERRALLAPFRDTCNAILTLPLSAPTNSIVNFQIPFATGSK